MNFNVHCNVCGNIVEYSSTKLFFDRTANTLTCSRNCAKVLNFKYSLWIIKRVSTYISTRQLVTETIKLLGNIPNINELCSASFAMADRKISKEEILLEIETMLKEKILV